MEIAEGFTAADYEDEPPVEVWPENWPAFQILAHAQTQWFRGGMNGAACGLRYEAIYPLIDRRAATRDEWDDLFECIRTMELAALPVLNKKPE